MSASAVYPEDARRPRGGARAQEAARLLAEWDAAGYVSGDGKPVDGWHENGSDEPGPLAVSWWDGAEWGDDVDVEVDDVREFGERPQDDAEAA